jgi:hypothetical protein
MDMHASVNPHFMNRTVETYSRRRPLEHADTIARITLTDRRRGHELTRVATAASDLRLAIEQHQQTFRYKACPPRWRGADLPEGWTPPNLSTSFSVSPDSRWIVYARTERTGSDILMLEGFR